MGSEMCIRDSYKAYDALKSRYERQMHEWEKASYELELTENG